MVIYASIYLLIYMQVVTCAINLMKIFFLLVVIGRLFNPVVHSAWSCCENSRPVMTMETIFLTSFRHHKSGKAASGMTFILRLLKKIAISFLLVAALLTLFPLIYMRQDKFGKAPANNRLAR